MTPPRIYWDANVLLSYLNAIPDRLAVIDELLRKSRAKEIELVTSALSLVEVAFAQAEKDGQQLDPQIERKIDELWAPGSPVKTVEFYDLVAFDARDLIRRGISQGWGSLKPIDAVHVATAQRLEVSELHTYCHRIQAWNGQLGFPITEPTTPQAMMDTGSA